MTPVDAPLRVRELAGLPQNPVGERRRALLHPASLLRVPEALGPHAPGPRVTGLLVLAPPQGSLRWYGDVFVAVDEVTPRKVGSACYADPGGLDDALGRTSVRDRQGT